MPSFVSSLLSESVSALSVSRWRASAVLRSSSVSVASGSVAYLDDERAILNGWRWRVGKSAGPSPSSVDVADSAGHAISAQPLASLALLGYRASEPRLSDSDSEQRPFIARIQKGEKVSHRAGVADPIIFPFWLFVCCDAGTSLDFQQT